MLSQKSFEVSFKSKIVYNLCMKKICLVIFFIIFLLNSFGCSKSLASSDIVILNTNNNKYHKVDCEYAKYIKNGKNIRKSLIRYSSAACCFPQKEKQQSLVQKYKVKKIFNKINEDKISLFFVDPVKAKRAQNKIINDVGLSLVALIDNAQTSIDVAAYGFDGQDDIINALRRAKKRGVKIRGVVDDYGATLYKRTNSVVKEFGFIYDSDLPLLQKSMATDETRSQSALMHNKFFVIDRKYVWTGSTNITNYCMTLNANNAVVILSEDLAKAYSKEFEQMFLKNNFHISKIKTEQNSFVIDNSDVKLYFSPMDNAVDLGIIPLIRSAKKSIHVTMFYLTNSDIIEELISAKKRGVEIKVIVDSSLKYEKQARHMQLIEAGIPVKIENWKGKLHQKSAIVDGEYTIVGSTNWTKSANIVNDENMLIIKNEKIAQKQEKEFLRLWKSIK